MGWWAWESSPGPKITNGQSTLDMTLDIFPGLAGDGAIVQLHLSVVGDHVSGGAGNALIDANCGHT